MIDMTISLEDKYDPKAKRAYMTGIEALVRLPMLQRQRDLAKGINTAGFISGYRGSPLGGVDQAMWRAEDHLKKHHIHFQPGINEDLAATAVWGSQQVNLSDDAIYDGVFAMWYGKGPGVDRSMDVIKHANAFGTSKFGGVLAVAGDDHACKSSTLPHQSEHMFIGASVPVLNPANVQEVLDLGIFGWELSRYTGSWVALKAITENMDSAISADIDPERINIKVPTDFELPADGVHARWPDRPLDQEKRLNKFKIYAAREFARVNNLNKIIVDSSNPVLGIITTGKSYLDVMQALEDLGLSHDAAAEIGIRVYKVGMSWPLEPVKTHEFARGLSEILVVEEKRSIIEDQLTGQLYNWPTSRRPRVVGEFDEEGEDLLPNLGELTPAMIARVIARRLAKFYSSEMLENRVRFINEKEERLLKRKVLAERMPHYCSGCPHNTSTKIPEGSKAMAGIGCHYMATWMPEGRNGHTFTQMGGEGVTWVGQAPFTKTKHVFQNLGDGTYFHSGILAIRQAVSAGVNITYKILFNDAVAMTGGQSVDGELNVDRLILQLQGEGVKHIAWVIDEKELSASLPSSPSPMVSVHSRDELDSVQRDLREREGCTVIVYQQTCAAEKRRRRKKKQMVQPTKRLFINSDVCEGCGDCGVASNCLSVQPKQTELGLKRKIDQSSCNFDYSCVKGFCPSFVSVEGVLKRGGGVKLSGLSHLPEPMVLADLERPWNIVASGVGGTGVLTVTSLIAMAAHLEGKGCATMNQTGLAQKFGAVVCHVRVAKTQSDIFAVRVPAGEADLLLGCDLVVAASDEALAKVDAPRSHAVVNEVDSPTSQIFSDRDSQLPIEALKADLIGELSPELVSFVKASELAEKLIGDSIAGNLMLMGVAYQKGLLPVSEAALFRAIELNGVAIESSKKAFTLGRHYAHNPKSFNSVLTEFESVSELSLDDLIKDRYSRLCDYQDRAYAERYLSVINSFRSKIDSSYEKLLVSEAARQLFKLMAYKDEYEVARMLTSDSFEKDLERTFESGYKLSYNMAPPLFSKRDAQGHLIKREFGPWMKLFLKFTAKLKGLRGTRFDVYGYQKERKYERQAIEDYISLINLVIKHFSASKAELASHLLSLPSELRGYGHVKERAYKKYQYELDRLTQQLTATRVDVVNIVEPKLEEKEGL